MQLGTPTVHCAAGTVVCQLFPALGNNISTIENKYTKWNFQNINVSFPTYLAERKHRSVSHTFE